MNKIMIKGATSALLFGGIMLLAGCGSSCCKKDVVTETKEDITVVDAEKINPVNEVVATPVETTVTEVVVPAQEQPTANI